jgi:bacillithiol synthase
MAAVPLKDAYLAGQLSAFHPWLPDIAEIPKVIEARAKYESPNRAVLVAALQEQYAGLPTEPAVERNLQRLLQPTCYTVTTGQQPGLFGGPMYTILKAVTTVLAARELAAKYPQWQFVPVFWIAGEDHDWAEIDHWYPNFTTKLTYKGTFHGAVGRHRIQADAIQQLLGEVPDLASYWNAGRRWEEAFRLTLHALLGREGLLILDPDNAELKRQFLPVIRRELVEKSAAPLVNATGEKLRQVGHKPQLHASDVCLFYLTDEARIKFEPRAEGRLEADGITKPVEAWLLEAEEFPERFSPNAALRPVYQETILPNVAYIGGWAEVAYWLQLKDVFALHHVPYPLLLPRAQALLLTQSQQESLGKLNLDLRTLLLDKPALRHYLAQKAGLVPDLSEAKDDLEKGLSQLSAQLGSIDDTLARSAQSLQQRNHHWLERLERRILIQLERKYPQHFGPVYRLRKAIQPEGAVQERVMGIESFDGHAPKAIVTTLLEKLQPFAKGIQTVEL